MCASLILVMHERNARASMMQILSISAIQSIFLSSCDIHFFLCYRNSHSLSLTTVHSCPYFADCAHFGAFSKFAGSFGIISLRYHCYNENNRSVFQLSMYFCTEALQKLR